MCIILFQAILMILMNRSQQKIADMKVVSQVMTESKWQDDKDINGCQICKSIFSMAKRKVSMELAIAVIVSFSSCTWSK